LRLLPNLNKEQSEKLKNILESESKDIAKILEEKIKSDLSGKLWQQLYELLDELIKKSSKKLLNK